MKIEVFNTTRVKFLPLKKLAKAIDLVLNSEKKKMEVNLILTGTDKIRNLNRTYRNQDKVTDVLSFALDDGEDPPPFIPSGEIYICVEKARKQAKQQNHSLQKELLFLTIHGALHLCGFTHETDNKYRDMMEKTSQYLQKSRKN